MRWRVGPTKVDRWIADGIADHATPAVERSVRILTLAGDEKLLVSVIAALWIGAHIARRHQHEANYVMTNVLAADGMSHLLKNLVAQQRPDRRMVLGPRRGIPRSGNPYDAFPSGHAMLAGVLAASLSRIFPLYRPVIWAGATVLAGTRVVLLAHWLSDVVVGLGLGAALEALRWRLSRRGRQ
jgi:membrane-associated phospholipid phosphatase